MMVLVAGLAAALTLGAAARSEERTVIKSRVYLVKEPSFLASRTSRTLQRGEKIKVELPGRGSWLQAQVGQEKGYIHLSYVSRPPSEFKVSASSASTADRLESMTSGEHNLAVGGFTEAVERTWRSEHPDVEKGFLRLHPFMPPLPDKAEGAAQAEQSPEAAQALEAEERLTPEPATPDPESLAAFAAAGGLRLPPPPPAEAQEPTQPPASPPEPSATEEQEGAP